MKTTIQTTDKTPLLCYGLLPSEMLNPTLKQVTPIIIKEGERGYFPTNWTWNREHAEEALRSVNAGLGITPEQAEEMMSRSIFNTWTPEQRRAANAKG